MNDIHKTHKILIVDDQAENIAVLAETLKTEYKIVAARGGEKALQIATSHNPPDLILLDVMMPDMDGYEVCQQLKAHETTCNIPVIFVTAMGEIEDETKGLEMGAIDYLVKPISPPIVKARIKNHLELKRAREAIEAQKHQLERQNTALIEAADLREDVERMTRHDLKNPLNTIIGFPAIIAEHGNLSPEQLDYLTIIEEAGFRMLNMINLSLDLFKMERGIYQVAAVPVNLVNVTRKITSELHSLLQAKRLVLDVYIGDQPVTKEDVFLVQGEELLCYSMLANLIKNALEASGQKETVTVKLLHNQGTPEIHIHNNGVIPHEIRETFFEKYVTAGKKNGTGLGTYSAKLIAETQQARIRMQTSEEEGTTISIHFPQSL